MKELSIEEKAKRYDEAIKVAKDSFNYPDYPGFIRADVVFPELKESEDDKIWKEIRDFICWTIDKGYITKYLCERSNSWLVWLEKQGKKKLAWNERDENLLKTIFNSLNTYVENVHPCIKSIVKDIVKDEILWLKSLKERIKEE